MKEILVLFVLVHGHLITPSVLSHKKKFRSSVLCSCQPLEFMESPVKLTCIPTAMGKYLSICIALFSLLVS